MNSTLNGKCAIVTGASRGIGAAIAADLVRNGMDVLLVARNASAMQTLAESLASTDRRVLVHAADLTHAEAATQTVQRAMAELGALDLLVNSAGDTKRGDFFALTEQDWAGGFGLKFYSAVRLCRAAWPHLKARQGSVVNIVGIGSRTPSADFTIGGAVNSALVNFTKALADIGLRDGVRVNAVNPGWIATERLNVKIEQISSETGLSREAAREELRRSSGIQRIGEPEDIANLVTFLASDQARYICGATLDVDGGATRGI